MPEQPEPIAQQQIVTRTAFDPIDGRVKYVVTGNEAFVLFPDLPDQSWIDGEWDVQSHYILAGEAVPRPVTGLPASHSIAAGIDWPIADVPAGTTVLINGEEVGNVDETGLTLTFALAGIWRVDLRPPFPWVDASCEVTVT